MQTKAKPKILIVEDNPGDVLIYRKCLGRSFKIESMSTGEEALGVIEHLKPDAVILDINLPGLSGYDICKVLRARPLKDYIGIVMITANEDPESIEKSLISGADSFGTKSQVIFQIKALLQSALRIQETMRLLNDVNQKLQRANDRLRKLSLTDDLTGLYNMRFMARQIRNEFKRAERYQKTLSMIMLDIDNFKRVNDAYDHLTGSFVISQVAQQISDLIRLDIDYGARYGGDEFIIVLPETDLQGCHIVAERLRKKVAEHIYDNGIHSVHITLSLGIAAFDGPGKNMQSVEELTRTADLSLLKAKALGKNQSCALQGLQPEVLSQKPHSAAS